MFRGDGRAVEFEVAGGAGVFGDDDLESQIGGGAGSGIHTHMGHHAGDDHTLDTPLFEHAQ